MNPFFFIKHLTKRAKMKQLNLKSQNQLNTNFEYILSLIMTEFVIIGLKSVPKPT